MMQLELDEPGLVTAAASDIDLELVREALRGKPEWLRGDPKLLAELGLRLDAANVVDFGPFALSRVSAAHQRESSERKRLEAMARANFAAQAQTHAAVLDVIDAADLGDLALKVDDLARRRFGLAFGGLALEGGEPPQRWMMLVEGQADLIMEDAPHARLGHIPIASGLFGSLAPAIQSVALARLTIWDPACKGVMAFGSTDPDAFTPDMGIDLVTFLARVVERIAERWSRP